MEMSIDSIRVSLMNYQRVVILKETNSERYLPIWIGPAEADAIAVKLQDVSVPRPLTHDLLTAVIGSLGGSLGHVIVCDLQNDTFFAKVVLKAENRNIELDARPSDAIALAVRTGVPIYAEENVMEKAGIVLDRETGKPLLIGDEVATEDQGGSPIAEEEIQRLSAFRDFIQELNLEDLGKKGEESGS